VNGKVQLQALVDGKKIIITESIVRRDLQPENAEGIDCLANATIFEELTRMGYEKHSQKLTFYKAFFSPQWKFLIHIILQCLSSKTTAWNEFSSTMAFAIICLAINQKFNFSKYIFESMVKNPENVSGKFLMYPRFVQVFLNKQMEGMASHNRIYVTPSHTKKVVGNMKRVGKGFSGSVTPLFPTMVVQAQEEMGKDEAVNEEMDDSLVRATTTATSFDAEQDRGNIDKTRSKATFKELSLKLKEFMDFCTKLQQRVLDLENTKTTQAQEITSLKLRVKKLEKKGGLRTHKLKRLYKVGLSRRVESSDEASLDDQEDASKQGRKIHDIDADEDITLENVYDAEMFDVNDLHGDEVFVEKQVPVKEVSVVGKVNAASIATKVSAATITEVDITLAQALVELKSAKPKATTTLTTTTAATIITTANTRPKAKGLVIHEHEKTPTPTPIVSSQQSSLGV
ncbi:hypothetical protein Tco_1471722, partial [Tanacetum coccineum]